MLLELKGQVLLSEMYEMYMVGDIGCSGNSDIHKTEVARKSIFTHYLTITADYDGM